MKKLPWWAVLLLVLFTAGIFWFVWMAWAHHQKTGSKKLHWVLHLLLCLTIIWPIIWWFLRIKDFGKYGLIMAILGIFVFPLFLINPPLGQTEM